MGGAPWNFCSRTRAEPELSRRRVKSCFFGGSRIGLMIRHAEALLSIVLVVLLPSQLLSAAADQVVFRSGDLTLYGELYKPGGAGPFPAVVYNHGSAPGMLSKEAFD